MNSNLTKLQDLIINGRNEGSNPGRKIDFKCKNGDCIGINLYDEPDVGVMRLYMSKGAEFPEHVHEKEKEVGIIYSGKLLLRRGDKLYKLGIGDHFYCEKGECHAGKALEDCWIVFVSVPCARGYPNG